jgi:hypothetical protein
MGGTSKLAVVLALVALAIGLAACGGGDDSTQSSDSSTAGTAQETTATTTTQDRDSSSSTGEGSSSFRTPGGDNSIQNYGDEADASEVEAAAAVLAAFLQTRAKDDWAKECSYLAKSAVAPIEQLASSAPKLKGKGCAAILAALMSRAPVSTRANPLTGGVASLRVDGDRGFALFHGAENVDYFVPMVKEDGEWMVGALAPSPFP